MQGIPKLDLDVAERPLRTWICVLLTLLILYNPFLAFTHTHSSFSVHEQARHRATVGASEMQHLGVAQDQNPQEAANVQRPWIEFAAPAAESGTRGLEPDVEVPQPDRISRIWSRPPPLV
jgi:hypothetical protein